MVHSLTSVFSPTLLSGSSRIAVSSCSISSRSTSAVSYFRIRGFQFFRFICLFCPTLFSLRACRACVRTRGLISINFITPWSCLQFLLRIVAPEQKSFRGNFYYLTLSSVLFSYGG